MANFIRKRFEHRKISPADAADCQAILQQVAVNLLRAGVGSTHPFAAADALAPAAANGLDEGARLSQVETRLAQLIDTGIVTRTRRGTYQFFHLNVQDYFAARGMRDLSIIDLGSVHWRQILLFRVEMADGPVVLDLIRRKERESPSPYMTELLTAAEAGASRR
jgi:hypothetical protein